jgi:hypothetical protein
MTVATLSSTESRHAKALALFEQRGQWLTVRDRDGHVLVGIPSQTKRGLVHLVATDGSSCDCYDFRNGHRVACKHTLAVKLGLIANGADSTPASVVVDGLAQMASDRELDRILGEGPSTYETTQRAAAAKYDEIFKRFEGTY